MKECELCGVRAWMYCEADHASLCWDCDEKVHEANFLVAKHSRTLMCHVCQSMTPWTRCGAKLTPTVSVCQSCLQLVQSHNNKLAIGSDDLLIDLNKQQERESEEEEDYDEDDDDEDDDDEVEDEDDNQVVPWSPPAETSFSGSEAEISVSKRVRQNVHVDSSDDDEVLFDRTASFGGSLQPLKRPRLISDGDDSSSSETEWGAASTIMRLENERIYGVRRSS